MPFTKKGNTIYDAMVRKYGSDEAKHVFYGAKANGTITGVDKKRKRKKRKSY